MTRFSVGERGVGSAVVRCRVSFSLLCFLSVCGAGAVAPRTSRTPSRIDMDYCNSYHVSKVRLHGRIWSTPTQGAFFVVNFEKKIVAIELLAVLGSK